MLQKLKLSRYYNKYSLVLFGNGIQQFVGLATGALLFHFLSPADAGMYFLVVSFVGLCESGRNGFLATATVKFYAGTDEARAKTVLGSVWILAIACTAIIVLLNAVALLSLPYTSNQETILCVKWIGITYTSSLITDVMFWRLQAQEKYGKIIVLRLFNNVASILAFVILILLHKFTLEAALLYNLLTNFLACLVGVLWGLSGFSSIAHRSTECMKEITVFGKYTFGTTVFSTLFGNSDLWLVNFIIGPAAVAIYNLAIKFIGLVELAMRSFVTIAMSEMAIAFNAKNMERLVYIFKKYTGMLTIGLIPCTIISFLLAGFLIRLYGGHQFDGTMAAQATATYRLLMILAIASPMERFNGLALDIMHKTKANFHKVIIMFVVRVITGFVFTELLRNVFGIVVAQYCMTFAAILYGYYQLRKSIDYTIPGVLSTGYAEMKFFLKKELRSKKTS